MTKLFLIILYEEKILNSRTILSFINCDLFLNKNNKFVIWDNSPTEINSVNECTKFIGSDNVEFHHTPENLSLSKIYNFVIKNNKADIYCIFDQDSELTRLDYDKYLDSVVYENKSINIFLPKIYSHETLYSPGRFWICRGSHYGELEPGIHEDKKYTAITSGMCIRENVFQEKNIWFNEDLQLYGIDTCFINMYRKIDKRFFVLDMVMNHDLSQDSLSEESKKTRILTYCMCSLKSEKNIFFKVVILCYIGLCKILGKI